MNRALLHISLLLLPLLLAGQTTQKVSIDWSELLSVKSSSGTQVYYYVFNDATNLFEFGALPLYVIDKDLPPAYFDYQIEIDALSFDTLEIAQAELLTDIESLSAKPEIRIRKNEKNTRVYILPIYKSDEGKIVRLINFKVHIDLVPDVDKPSALKSQVNYANESVLSSGTWYKLGIVKTGVHKLTYTDLENFGIDASQLDPQKLGIFGNYSGMLPEENMKNRKDDLYENAIVVFGEEDGVFNENDYILFYAQSGAEWKYNVFSGRFDHTKNLYADTSFVFLTTDRGNNKRTQTIDDLNEEPTQIVQSFYDYDAHENDLVNLMHSGKQWYGELFEGDTMEHTFTFLFPNLKTDKPVYLYFEMVARGQVNTYAEVYSNNQLVIDSTRFTKIASSSAIKASLQSRKVTFFAEQDQLDVKVKYYTDDPAAKGWLNFLVLNAERDLRFEGGQMKFCDPHVSASGNITKFEVENVTGAVTLWDISDPFNPLGINFNQAGSQLNFIVPTDTLREFLVFDNSGFYTPVNSTKVKNQNLHGISSLNFVIISPELFIDQATRLADIHTEEDGLQTIIVKPEEIYNEFSSGSQDITAIRDFMRMLYIKGAFGDEPGYLLLFGDASFDYRHRIHDNTNIIPTYQSKESRIETKSFVTDDYFGLLDDNEGLNASGNLDIGIGRFPVSTIEQATTAVNKVEHYLQKSEQVMRPWRNNVCFIADDEDQNLHFRQAKYMIGTLDTIQPSININKIFSDAHTKINVPGGKRFPEVNGKINEQVENGALIINYTGHGGLIGWSEELILDVPTIRSYDNLDNMPLFVTATCEFSRFDNPEFVSAGEYLFLNEKGGSIGLLTTTRLAFAAANIIVNQRIYEHFMDRGDGGRPRIGDLVRLSKIPSNENFLNFALLGDPALMLAYPEYDVVTTSINDQAANSEADTVHALTLVTVKGSILNEGVKMDHFNGYVYPKVYDKETEYMTLGTESGSFPEEFDLLDRVLFDGKASVTNGDFEFSFLVPKDISYKYGFGKISYYALDTTAYIDAWGSYNQLFIGGMDTQFEPDDTGPQIVLFMDSENFSSGDAVPTNSYFHAQLFDENGIHSTGQSLGRDITLTMDEDYANTMVMNSYFQADIDTYKSGQLSYLFEGLTDGWHSLTLKAWDLLNNSSEVTIEFYVDEQADIMLSNVFNYPNPFSDETYFGFAHNKNGNILDVEINIYDINGRFVTTLKENVASAGNQAVPIKWDGRDHNGNPLPGGLFTYNIIVTDYAGNSTIQRQKLIKLSD